MLDLLLPYREGLVPPSFTKTLLYNSGSTPDIIVHSSIDGRYIVYPFCNVVVDVNSVHPYAAEPRCYSINDRSPFVSASFIGAN